MNQMKTLKDYIVGYQNGNEEELNKLIRLRETKEKNNNGEYDTIYRLRFTDKALHNIYLDILQKHFYIDSKDIDSYVLVGITKLLDKVDTNKEPEQVLSYFKQRLNGFVKNQIENEKKKRPDNVYSETYLNGIEYGEDDEKGEKSLSLYDRAVVNQYKLINDQSGYKEFIGFVGGKVENILSAPQQKVYQLVQSGDMTQQAIAEELNCTQENVSQIITAMNNRIKKEYLSFRTYKALAAKPDTYQKINSFIDNYNQIIKFDVSNSFDYFGYVLEFVKTEVEKNHSTIDMDFYKPEQDIYDYFNRNKESHNDSVVDVIIDRCNKPTFNIIKAISEDKEPRVKDTAQDKFVIDIVKVFNQYISDIQKVIHNANGYLVQNGLDNQNKMFDKVS